MTDLDDHAAHFGNAVLNSGGRLLELRQRPFRIGVELVIWTPTRPASALRDLADRYGWQITLFTPAPVSAESECYDGFQLRFTIPQDQADMLRSTMTVLPTIGLERANPHG